MGHDSDIKQQGRPVLDIHCHVAGIGAGNSGCFVSSKLKNNFRYGIYLKAFGVTRHELERQGDSLVIRRLADNISQSLHVDAAVALALDGVIGKDGALDYNATELFIPNDFIFREVAGYENLYCGASVNPYRANGLDLLDEVAARGAVLIKWLPSIQHIDPADEQLVPFYRKLAKLNLPLLTHTGEEGSFTRARQELADPARLHLPLSLGVTVIAAHCASTGKNQGEPNLARLLALFFRYPNLYADISSLTQINRPGHLARILQHREILPRLLYGSDAPLIATALVSPWYFPFQLSCRQIIALTKVSNPWDQDVLLKQALGVPPHVFSRPYKMLIEKTI